VIPELRARAGAAMCSPEYHASIKSSPIAFRAGVRFTFASWGVDEAGRDAEY
jgi:hypothetical protein